MSWRREPELASLVQVFYLIYQVQAKAPAISYWDKIAFESPLEVQIVSVPLHRDSLDLRQIA